MRVPGPSSANGCVNMRETSITIVLSGPYASTLNDAMIGLTFAFCTASYSGVPGSAKEKDGALRSSTRLSRRSQRSTRLPAACPP